MKKIMKIIYDFFRLINALTLYAYRKLPKYIRVLIIYLLILLPIYQYYHPRTITIEKCEMIPLKATKTPQIQPKQNLKGIEQEIYKKALEQGLDNEKALLLIAISKHETGNWTSRAFNKLNNFGGIMGKNGLRSYQTKEIGLISFINLLKNRYFAKGLNTIDEIGNVYCPVGATNDPNNKNQYWKPYITKYYNEYVEKSYGE